MHIDPKPIRAAAQAAAESPGGRCSRNRDRLLIRQVLAAGGQRGKLLHHAERPWASATFTGARHTVTLRFAGPAGIQAGESFIDLLPDLEFTIPGQIVGDAAIVAVDHVLGPPAVMTVTAELLLIEDVEA